MASFLPIIISPLLKEATELKIEELGREKEAFKNRYLGKLDAEHDALTRITTLLEQMKNEDPELEDDDDLEILERLVEQAKKDPSVSAVQLQKYEKQLRDKPDLELRRLDVSSCHAELLKEAMNAAATPAFVTAKLENDTSDDEFELVEGPLEAAFDEFEKRTFTEKNVDEGVLGEYLNGLFDSEAGREALESLREGVDYIFTAETCDRITEEVVEWCIKDLLEIGLHDEETKKTLQGYLQSPSALRELKSALQVRTIRHWNWRNPGEGLPVTARQDAEGKYRIIVEEDLMDMLFLHIIAVQWSTKIKGSLQNLISDTRIWPRGKGFTEDEMLKRDYYLFAPKPPKIASTQSTIRTMCHIPPPPPPMPIVDAYPPPPPVCAMPPPPPPPGHWKKSKKAKRQKHSYSINGLEEERYRRFTNNFFLARLPGSGDDTPELTAVHETRAALLKYLATELKLRNAFDGEARAFTSSFSSLASSLSHKTILTVLKFIGVSDMWLNIFTRFLKAPLNIGPVVRGTADQVLTRACGIPIAHGLERLFSEVILFFLDVAVHKGTGGYLYRLGHEGCFIGNKDQSDVAKAALTNFATAMGLDLELDSEAIGFMKFDSSDLNPKLTIDTSQVEQYAYRVKKQLAACTSVLEWVRLWNHSIGTYASHFFGPLANVFGKEHLDRVTEQYNRMYEIIFERRNLLAHWRQLLAPHLPQSMRAPDFNLEPLIYLPTAYGGLGVKNPFIALNIARNIPENPETEIQDYLDAEKHYYANIKAGFESQSRESREKKLQDCFENDKERIAKVFGQRDTSEFMSFEEFVANREFCTYPSVVPGGWHWHARSNPFTPPPSTLALYNSLLCEPTDVIESTMKICDAVKNCAGKNGMRYWCNISGEDKWMLVMYGEEVIDKFGGLEMWRGDCVPKEALMLVRGEENMFEDEDSCSDITEV
ncbi:hypothetical protein BDV96DRAFT_615154 [Lophiotrema nucula]|uniref:Uncharacterized protein n=1 Tax=Lophiotrema nucula TaxID=690887 RepID=A0A6A5YUL9_9PLEO|nr:hypothetical protein BDV96DRAFT_615154 [Lophiotrema nucula]